MKTTTLEVMERRMRFRNYSGQTIKTYTSYASKFLNSFESDAYHIPTKEAKNIHVQRPIFAEIFFDLMQ